MDVLVLPVSENVGEYRSGLTLWSVSESIATSSSDEKCDSSVGNLALVERRYLSVGEESELHQS